MPIYEYYCPDNHTIYQFFAKTLAQGQSIPKCPDNPAFRLRKVVSAFAITKGGGAKDEPAEKKPEAPGAGTGDPAEDARMEAAMSAMEREFSSVDENDPKAMARMMRRMSDLTGEKIDGEMEEVVRKLEEGADPDSLEDQLGGGDEPGGGMDDPYGEGMGMGPGGPPPAADPKEPRHRFRVRRPAPRRDPKLYDYE
jgi:predicted nucleic acid-binding Zn ribbon protein